MAVCKECGSLKLTEQPCPACGNLSNGVSRQLQEVIDATQASITAAFKGARRLKVSASPRQESAEPRRS